MKRTSLNTFSYDFVKRNTKPRMSYSHSNGFNHRTSSFNHRMVGFNHNFPKRTASGFFDPEEQTWKWEEQQWQKCDSCGLYHGTRYIPEEFWDRDWKSSPRRDTAGVILTRQGQQGREFFVIQSYHNLFGFPKGKQEDNETLRETASRELAEETGIKHDLKGCPEFRQSGNGKTISFFFLNLVDQQVKAVPGNTPEITSFGWIRERDLQRLKLNQVTKDTISMFYRFN